MPGIVFFWWKVERFLPLTNHLRQLTDCRHLVNYSLHEKVEVTLDSGSATVGGSVTAEEVKNAVESIGYKFKGQVSAG